MKKGYLLFVYAVLAAGLYAQTPAKTARQGVKAIVSPSPAAEGLLLRMKGTGAVGITNAVDYRITQKLLQNRADVTRPPSAAAPARRFWVNQKMRDLKAWQLKRQRRARDAQNRQNELEKQRREALRAALPQLLPEQAFETENFAALIAPELPAAPLPLLEEPGLLYRGMALHTDGNALKNILQNGLQLKDLGNHATTKLLSVSGGQRGAVSAVRPVTNLTSFPQDALYWANQRKGSGRELPVIVAVEGLDSSGKIVLHSQDISTNQLAHVLVPLQVADVSTWCEVFLTQYGTFLLIPYGEANKPEK